MSGQRLTFLESDKDAFTAVSHLLNLSEIDSFGLFCSWVCFGFSLHLTRKKKGENVG